MPDKPTKDSKPKSKNDARADALRDNLLKRKQQARARKEDNKKEEN